MKNINFKIGIYEKIIYFDIILLDFYELILSILWLRKYNFEMN